MHTFKSTFVQIEEDALVRFDDEIIPAVAGTNILINNVWYTITEVALYCETLENSYSLKESIFVKESTI